MKRLTLVLGVACVVLQAMAGCGSDDIRPMGGAAPDGGTGGAGTGGQSSSTGGSPQATGGTSPNTGGTAPATGGAPAGTGGTPSNEFAQLCVDTINQYRATLGLAPYARWTAGESCANEEAKLDSESGTAHGAFGKCGESAQNECPGWPGPPATMIGGCLKMMWDEGPGADFSTHGHYINMSSTQYTGVACGAYDGPNGVWSVQNFH